MELDHDGAGTTPRTPAAAPAIGRRRMHAATAALAAAAWLLLSATAVGAAGPAPAATGRSGLPLTVMPGGPAADISPAGAFFTHSMRPGERWTDAVIAGNNSDVPVSASVYATDAVTAAATGVVYPARTSPATKAGRWVVPGLAAITVAPHGSVTVPFTVDVPPGAAPGDHLAGLAVEAENAVPGTGTFAVSTLWRVIVAVVIQVPRAHLPHIEVSGAVLQRLPRHDSVGAVVTMRNDGQMMTRAVLKVTVTSPSGYRREVDRQLGTMLPGDPVTYVLPWPDLMAPGAYDVGIDLLPLGAAEARFDSPASLSPPPAAVHDSPEAWLAAIARMAGAHLWSPVTATPLTAPVAGMGAAAMVGLTILRRRRHSVSVDQPT
ncbi:MAG: WxL protein peptidoglycan domain-containing protein [Candidatus Dormibacteria bacterium]